MGRTTGTEGSIERRGPTSWRIQVRDGRDPATGRYRRRRFTVRGTRRDAQRALREALSERDRGIAASATSTTVGDYLNGWLTRQALRLKESTLAGYRADVDKHFRPALGPIKLRDLRPAHVDALITRLLNSGRSPNTVRRLYRELHAALQTAVELRLIAVNPATAVRPPQKVQREMRVLSATEARRLLEAVSDTELHAIVYLALETGARSGELLGLRWSDIDLELRELRIRRSVREFTGRGVVELEPKTHRSRRSVALSEACCRVLRQHRSKQSERRLALGEVWNDTDLVFPSQVGTHWSPSNLRRAFRAAVRTAELDDVTLHTLRHTSASLMLMAGTPVTTVSAQLGHASPAITYSIYAHVLPGMQHEAADQLAAVLA